MSNLNNISVVLPSLDPDNKLIAVIDGLLEYGFTDIILINDGSKPENLHFFEEAASHPEVHLLHHVVNRGKGAALKTAFTWILENRPDSAGVITVDGDNQHHPEDTRRCALHMLETGHAVLGVRDFSQDNVPARSRFGNRTTSLVFKFFVGMTISDTQTGLRALPAETLPLMCKIKGDRFEYETNMLLAFKTHSIAFDEVKIRTVYIEENKSSHFRTVRDSWRIYKLILSYFFKYTLSSLVSSVVEIVLVFLLNLLLNNLLTGIALTASVTAGARILSSLVNFYSNKKLVFHSHASTRKSLLRYAILTLVCFVINVGLNEAVYTLFSISAEQELLRTAVHICVMTVMFFINYAVQQRWVFSCAEK